MSNSPSERFLVFMGKWFLPPFPITGVSFGHWTSLLLENRFRVHPIYWPRALLTTATSVANSFSAWSEQRKYGRAVEGVQIQSPLFILGHWRSGTTHLHNLLSQDPQFAFPNEYQTGFPHSFLSKEDSQSKLLARLLPKTRLIDNMELGVSLPQEDDAAICNLTLKSFLIGYCFPKRWDYYARYVSLKEVSPHELEVWRNAMTHFLKKLTWKYRKPLVLKSPVHTCRIKLLLEMFPDARFVHIHRNPYTVFQSMVHALEFGGSFGHLQRDNFQALNDRVITLYREMYDCFFEERQLIPEGKYHEMSFESLEEQPIREIEKLYQSLSLSGFAELAPTLERYLESQKGYQKNTFPSLDGTLRSRVFENWKRCFDEWGYER